jgi:hypothetical protein
MYQPGVHVEGEALCDKFPQLSVLIELSTSICRDKEERREWGEEKGDGGKELG